MRNVSPSVIDATTAVRPAIPGGTVLEVVVDVVVVDGCPDVAAGGSVVVVPPAVVGPRSAHPTARAAPAATAANDVSRDPMRDLRRPALLPCRTAHHRQPPPGC